MPEIVFKMVVLLFKWSFFMEVVFIQVKLHSSYYIYHITLFSAIRSCAQKLNTVLLSPDHTTTDSINYILLT